MTLAEPSATLADDLFADIGGGMRLCWRMAGRRDGEPVLLIAGLGLQLIYWPEAFVQALVSAGYRVIAPDNRDVGRSSRAKTRPPSKLRQLLAWAPADNYGIDDMADDMARLMRLLDIRRAHLVGMSMGGMIAQTLASRHPDRVISLTSIFSTTGHPGVGQPARSTLWRIARSSAPRSANEAAEQYAGTMRHIGDPSPPDIEAEWSRYALQAWERSGQRANASGIARQIGAIQKSGDRSEQLQRIEAPTLVIHGDRDLMVHPTGGRATADAIPGAQHVVVKGMRHQIDTLHSIELAASIVAHMRQASAARAPIDKSASGLEQQ